MPLVVVQRGSVCTMNLPYAMQTNELIRQFGLSKSRQPPFAIR